MQRFKNMTLIQSLPYLLVVLGSLGLLGAVILTVEKVHLLENPGMQLSCDLNPIVACGSVVNTDQASAFGFPNPIIGIFGFTIVVTIGMAILAGAKFKKWFWLGLEAGTIFGVSFVHWLFFQSVYNIEALCPYCMVVWAVAIALFLYVTLFNLRKGFIKTPKSLKALVKFIEKSHANVLVVWYLVIAGFIVHKFWYYWSTLF